MRKQWEAERELRAALSNRYQKREGLPTTVLPWFLGASAILAILAYVVFH